MSQPAIPLDSFFREPLSRWPDVVFPVWPEDRSLWYLPETDDEEIPLDTFVTQLQRYLYAVFSLVCSERGLPWFVSYEQKMALDEHDQRLGLFPDLYVLPCQPAEAFFEKWPVYHPDVPAPVFAMELVSSSNWEKDYHKSPGKYAVMGTQELVVYDREAYQGKTRGTASYGLQVYRRGKGGELRKEYAGEGPVWSEVMGVWLHGSEEGVSVSWDEEGKEVPLTMEEAETWWKDLKEAKEQAKEEREARQQAEEAKRQAEEEKRRAEEAKRQAEERERQAKEEKRRAEEEKRHAEEEKRHAEEEKRHAEEEKRRAEEEKRLAQERERQAQERALAEAREAVLDLCDLLAIGLTPARRAQLDALDLDGLRALRSTLKSRKAWP